jgi:hypothetical protein
MKNNFLRKPFQSSNDIDALEANALFSKFFKSGFDYDEASRYGDYFSLASADVFVEFLPELVDGYKKNPDHFIIYPILSALNPDASSGGVNIAPEIQNMASIKTRNAILKLIDLLESAPPIPDDEFSGIVKFWRGHQN